ncbi:MAG: type VI secretion system protein [Myxococcota bacterium]|jgi:type VI secretion system protein
MAMSVLCVMASACSTAAYVIPDPKPLHMSVTVDPDANNGFPVAVSVVLVYGEVLLAKLKEMPAKQWFDERKQLRRDFPDCSGYASFDWEWVPGDYVGPITIMVPPEVGDNVFIYANYLSKGEHRNKASAEKGIHLQFKKEEVESRPLGEDLVTKMKVDPRRTKNAPRCLQNIDATGDGGSIDPAAAKGAAGKGLKGAKGVLGGK